MHHFRTTETKDEQRTDIALPARRINTIPVKTIETKTRTQKLMTEVLESCPQYAQKQVSDRKEKRSIGVKEKLPKDNIELRKIDRRQEEKLESILLRNLLLRNKNKKNT